MRDEPEGTPFRRLRALARNVTLYGFALFAPRVVRLITLPLITFAVSLRVYGTYALLSLMIPFVHTLCELGMGTAALRLSPEADATTRRALFSTVFASRMVLSGLATLVLFLARAKVARLLTGDASNAPMVTMVAATVWAMTLFDAFADQLRAEERHRLLAGLLVMRTLAVNGLAAFLVVVAHWGLTGLIAGRLIADVAMFVTIAWICRGTLRVRPTLIHFVALARLGAPMAMLYLLTNLRELDRLMVKWRGSVEDVGTYDLAMRIVGPVALANLALSLVLEPHVYRHFQSPRARETIEHFFRGYVVVFSIVAATVAVMSPEIFSLIAPESYGGAARAAPVLIFGFVADGVLRVAGIGADLAKRTGLWAIAALVQVVVSLSIGFALIPTLGIVGAGAGFLVGSLVAAVLSHALARKLFALTLPVARAVLVIVVGAALATLVLGLAPRAPSTLVVRLIALSCFSLFAVVLTRFELGKVRGLLR